MGRKKKKKSLTELVQHRVISEEVLAPDSGFETACQFILRAKRAVSFAIWNKCEKREKNNKTTHVSDKIIVGIFKTIVRFLYTGIKDHQRKTTISSHLLSPFRNY